MAIKIKVQRIAYCTQCECLLPKRCTKCVAHPDRKPRIVEIYDAPKILKTNECGCVGFRCQRVECMNTRLVWRHPRADGTLGFKNHFCSPECVRIVTAAARKAKRITETCSCGCGRTVTRPASCMRAKHTYFSQLCHFRHRTQLAAERKEARRLLEAKLAALEARRATLECLGRCGNGLLTEHLTEPGGKARCRGCGAVRAVGTSSITVGELRTLTTGRV